jgi:Arc/MetJ-type ribon-helix-helix transcriptional regulator
MVFGMATRKVTITLPDDQLAEIRRMVRRGRTKSVSAFVTRAVQTAIQDAAGWREMLAEALRETGGPPTAEERAWADSILGHGKPKRRPGKNKAA